MASPSITILGPSSLTANQISAWYQTLGKGNGRLKGVTVEQVIGWYVSEGDDQGVRGDVAFAQACWETGYFTNNDTTLNNYAGIGHPVSAPAGDDFASPQIGVRAQIQLLAKVAGGNNAVIANPPDVAPTWGGKFVDTWQGLSGNWAADPDYAAHIFSIYNPMLGGNPVLNTSADGTTTTTTTPPQQLGYVNTGTIPGIDPTWTANIDPGGDFTWPLGSPVGEPAAVVIADSITTDSTVDLEVSQLGQLQLTIVDPNYSITGGLIGQINQAGGVGPQLQWHQEVLTVSEGQTLDTDGVPCAILTLRTSCLEWMSTYRVRKNWTGISATAWVSQCVAEYNALLPPGVQTATFLGDYSAPNPSIMANPGETVVEWMSYYEIAEQLCYDEGFWLFETAGCVVFGKPSWIVTVAPSFTVGWVGLPDWPTGCGTTDVETINVPQILRSDQVFTGDTLQLDLPHDFGEQVRCGQCFTLSGFPWTQGMTWIVTGVQFQFDGQQTPVTISANQAKDPVPAAPGGITPAPPQTDPTGNPPTGTNLTFVQIAETQIGKPYVWGGASPSAGFDCSGLVMWALGQMGVSWPHYSGDQWQIIANENSTLTVAQAMNVEGALLFIDSYGANGSVTPGGEHVAISMGDGTHILQASQPGVPVGIATDRGGAGFNRAGTIPQLNYGPVTG